MSDLFQNVVLLVRERLQGPLITEIQNNKRLLWLFSALCLIIYISILVTLNSQLDLSHTVFQESRNELRRLEAQTTNTSWSNRLTDSRNLRFQLTNKLWEAQTPGLAEANFERWIRDGLSKGNMEARQVVVRRSPFNQQSVLSSATSNMDESMQRMTAKIITQLDPGGLIQFLAEAAEYEKWVLVDLLVIRTGRNPRLEIDVSTFLRVQETGS